MVETILSNPLFVEVILPFLLVFAVVFAILQKTKILGEGKKQIDAIVSLVVGLIVIAFAQAVNVIVYLVPILAVSVIVLLSFMILYGMVYKEGEFEIPKSVKVLAAIVIIVAVLFLTGAWDYLVDFVFFTADYGLVTNVIFIVVIIAAVVVVVWGGGKKKHTESKE